MGKKNGWAIPVAIIGAVLVAAAAILYWVVVPNQKQLPDDTNTTRQLNGTARVLLNPQALGAGDLANALMINVPVLAERNVKVLATDGKAAQVADTRVLKTAQGVTLGQAETKYAVDRQTLQSTDDYPSDWPVTKHEGLTVSWPIGSEQKEYAAWVNETKATTPAKFIREETKGGVKTYVYEVDSAAAPIKDEQVLAGLPKSMPAPVLAGLAPRLPLPDAVKAGLGQALPRLGDPVQLAYTYQVKATYWVEPTTGLVVDTDRTETRHVTLANGQLAVPIYEVQTKFTEASVTAASGEARDKSSTINTFGKTLPLLLFIPGILTLLIGVIGIVSGRRKAAASNVDNGPFVS